MAQWIQVAGAAASGPAGSSGSGAPAAPNVTSATVTVSYAPWANAQKVVFAGAFNLPTSDPNYNQDQTVTITAVDPNGNQFPVATFTGTPVSSPQSYYNINGPVIQQPVAAQTGWSLIFTCFNQDGVPSASPYTLSSITVAAASVISVGGAEIGPVYQDSNSGLHTVIELTPLCSQLPLIVTFWVDFDDGNGPIWQGWFPFTNTIQSIVLGQPTAANNGSGSIWVPVNAANSNWVVWASPGAINANAPGEAPPGWDNTITYAEGAVVLSGGTLYVSLQSTNLGNNPASSGAFWVAAVSGSFTVAVAQACPPNDCTGIQFLSDPNTGSQEVYAVNHNGVIVWIFYGLQFTLPTLAFDPYFWFAVWTVQLGFLSTGTCTVSGGTTLTDSTGPFTSNQVNYVMHVNNVWVLGTYSSATVMTLSVAQPNGSGIAYDIWNPAPVNATNGSQGTNEDPDLLYYGIQVVETGPNGAQPAVFTDFGNINPGWTYPPLILPSSGRTRNDNPYRTFKAEVYAVSRLSQNPAGGPQGETYTRQIWPSGSDAGYLTPLAPNSNLLNLGTVDGDTLGDGLTTDGNNLPMANLATPLTTLAGAITIAVNGVSNTYLATASADARVLAANSVTAANGAVAANAIVDSNVANVGVAKLIAGTVIFTGNVFLSQGSANPVIELSNTGIFLFGVAASGGGSGLTTQPYVEVASTGILVASGSNTSVTVTSASVNVWSVNGNTADPYLTVSTSGISIVNGNFTAQILAAQISLIYSLGASAVLNSAGLTITNGSYSTTIGSTSIVLTNGTSSVTINSSGVTIVNGILTSPVITITDAGNFIINMDSTNAIKVTSTSGTTYVSQLESGVLTLEDSVSNGLLLRVESSVGGNQGQVELTGPGGQISMVPRLSTTASTGSQTLPANPAGFFAWTSSGSTIHIPYYN